MKILYRPGSLEDSFAVFSVFYRSIVDLGQRSGYLPREGAEAPPPVEMAWPNRRTLFEHLVATADEFWVAQEGADIIGYGRSLIRDGVQQLSEFFVAPGRQSQGIGGELFRRAFPDRRARRRLIIATSDSRALPRYLRAGMIPSSPVGYLYGPAKSAPVDSDLEFSLLRERSSLPDDLDRIDREVLGFSRRRDHTWFAGDRSGFVALRDGLVVGYGYVGASSGPFAALEQTDLPAILGHAEGIAAGQQEEFGVELPLSNQAAVAHLLGRGYRLSPFLAHFLSDGPGVRLANYVFLSPPFFT